MAKLKTIISSMLGLLLMLILSNFVSATNYTGYQLFDYLNGTSGDVKACAYCATTNWFNFTNSVPCTYVSSGYSSCTGTASVSGLIGMLVPARIYATKKLLDEMDNGVFDQVTNVACLPGIQKAAYCMPDGHWGYGFPIGGVAAFDKEEGVISPGGN